MESKQRGYEKKKVRLLAKAKAEAAERGYVLHAEEWEGFRSKYNFTCPNGHSWISEWANFHRGNNCRRCHNESLTVKNPKFKGMSREEFRAKMDKEFRESLTAEGYTAREGFAYINNQTKVPVTCDKGHDYETTWNLWSLGKRCRKCFEERVIKSREEIAAELAAEGCTLVGDYYGANKPFKYICSCGTLTRGRIKDFRKGVRCRICAGEKVRETNRLKRLALLEKFDREHPEGESE